MHEGKTNHKIILYKLCGALVGRCVKECFEKISIEDHTHLIDVRTKPEWVYDGVPDLSSKNNNDLMNFVL